ncbi:unnamed protein product [Caretta caretta]
MPARHAYIQEQISASGNALCIALGPESQRFSLSRDQTFPISGYTGEVLQPGFCMWQRFEQQAQPEGKRMEKRNAVFANFLELLLT